MNSEKTSILELQANANGQPIISRNGRLLCSPRDPIREARDWVLRQKISRDDKVVIVLGAGAGFHILELRRQFPDVQIHILELDAETYQYAHKNESLRDVQLHLSRESLSKTTADLILPFRPAWADHEAVYLQIFLQLTQRSSSALQEQSQAQGLTLTSAVIYERLENLNFSLKNLSFAEEDNSNEEVKLWRSLRELIE